MEFPGEFPALDELKNFRLCDFECEAGVFGGCFCQ